MRGAAPPGILEEGKIVADNAYDAPRITEIASLHELTLDIDKNNAPVSDGFTFQGKPINVS
jgi:hypothetical protein